ncbi:MAG: glucosaminidase domain-containing protein, partial [Pseudomonadales bacterium]|nr:glucosaminidase domain-containing protein [Pseudomonadales bacterium]
MIRPDVTIRPRLSVVLAAAILLAGCGAEEEVPRPARMPVQDEAPDFTAFTDVKEKKKAFFEYMLPMVRNANAEVRYDRERLLAIRAKMAAGQNLSAGETSRLMRLSERYRLDIQSPPTLTDVDHLLQRVDVVPASLILAQSANESAWGTSRFARRGNNYFGIWCFEPGCGFTPRERGDGLTHEVA